MMPSPRKRPILSAVAWAGLTLFGFAAGAAPLGGLLHLRAQTGAVLGRGAAHAEARNCAGSARASWEYPNVNPAFDGAWRSLEAPKPMPAGPPKPAFLMMIYERIAFPESWEAFFRGTDRWTLLVHPKNCHPLGCKEEFPEFFRPYIRGGMGQSAFCKLGSLMLYMMSAALVDPEVSHLVWLSGDTMPVKPLAGIVADLAKDSRSRFCVDEEWERAETWSVMHRDHATLFNSNQQELWDMSGAGATCEEEDFFYWALKTRGEKVLDRCVMMTDWSDSPKAWNKVAAACHCPALVTGHKTPGSCGHPSVFRNITAAGYSQLVGSPADFWFARKFPGDGRQGVAAAWLDGTGSLDVANAKRLGGPVPR